MPRIPWLFPLLPLTSGFAAAIPHYSPWSAGEEWSAIRVVGSDVIALGARAVDCWVVDGGELFPGYTATYWIDKGTRRVVQGVARGAEGGPELWSRMPSPQARIRRVRSRSSPGVFAGKNGLHPALVRASGSVADEAVRGALIEGAGRDTQVME